jgi:excisionase family DNA binding protein
MNALLENDDVVVPTADESVLAKEASRALAASGEKELRIRLEDGGELVLPKSATKLIQHLLLEMSHGNAVTLIPIHAALTTQEAANILGVSRPYIVKLIDSGELPHDQVGTHRRIRFSDLENYRNRFEARRKKILEELADEAQDLGMGY